MEQIICVPLHTPVPRDPDLGWETDSPGERVTTAQLLDMLPGYIKRHAGARGPTQPERHRPWKVPGPTPPLSIQP